MDKNQVTQIMNELVNAIKVRDHIYTIVNGPRTQLVSKQEERELRDFANQLDRHVVDSSLAIKRGLLAQQQAAKAVAAMNPEEAVMPEPVVATEQIPRKVVRTRPEPQAQPPAQLPAQAQPAAPPIPTEADAERARHKAHRQAELIKQMQREMAEQDALAAAEEDVFEDEEPAPAPKRKTRAKKAAAKKAADEE